MRGAVYVFRNAKRRKRCRTANRIFNTLAVLFAVILFVADTALFIMLMFGFLFVLSIGVSIGFGKDPVEFPNLGPPFIAALIAAGIAIFVLVLIPYVKFAVECALIKRECKELQNRPDDLSPERLSVAKVVVKVGAIFQAILTVSLTFVFLSAGYPFIIALAVPKNIANVYSGVFLLSFFILPLTAGFVWKIYFVTARRKFASVQSDINAIKAQEYNAQFR